MDLTLRKWQQEAIRRSDRAVKGIFLEARGGKGKTIAALAIVEYKKAKRVMILNNTKLILAGWQNTINEHFSGSNIEFVIKTDKWLASKISNLKELETKLDKVKKKLNNKRKLYNQNWEYQELNQSKKNILEQLNVDILIVDEWQNMCSNANTQNYLKIKRDYTIGLSATPIREKGLNFYPLEKTIFGKAVPNAKNQWVKDHGQMIYDEYAFAKERWQDFRDYENYVRRLDVEENFFRWEEINELEKAIENNGFNLTYYRPNISVPEINVDRLATLNTLNLVEVDGEYVMAKSVFGKKHFERYLNQSVVGIDFPKLYAKKEETPLSETISGMVERTPHGLLVVGESLSIIRNLFEQCQNLNRCGLKTGKEEINYGDCQVLFATSQAIGVGVDGLQHRFQTLVSLDPIQDLSSGEYNDYRQLLWRISGDRQVHDVNIVEIQYVRQKLTKPL